MLTNVCSVCSASVDVSSKCNVKLYFMIVHKGSTIKYLDKSEIRMNKCLRHRSECRLLVEIAGLNPAGRMEFVCCEYCVFRYRSLRRVDHSSTEVLPIVLRRCV
jgi:hypothetical protein